MTDASCGRRQAFFYWRVGPEQLAMAVAAVQAWQARLKAEDPALRAQLFVRHETDARADAPATLMEVYASTAGQAGAGIGADTLQRLVTDGDGLTTPWRLGARHAEVFDAIGGADPLS